jgi:hypothetical protein
MSTESRSREGIGETGRPADGPVPNTRAPEAGSPPAAGRVSPAEKSEPAGVPSEEQRHNPDPNAPQNDVRPPGASGIPESETGGVPLSSLRQEPELGTDEARARAQIRYSPPPEDAADGVSIQDNDPDELPRLDDDDNK